MGKREIFEQLRVRGGEKVRLNRVDTESMDGLRTRESADEATERKIQQLGELQTLLYAEGRQSLLVVLQGMDASGKDGAVRRVFDTVNPAGGQVVRFKQ